MSCALRAIGEAESRSHIRLSDRCPLARLRERRDIFAAGEYLGGSVSLPGCRFSFLWGVIRFELRSARRRRSRIQYCHSGLICKFRSAVTAEYPHLLVWQDSTTVECTTPLRRSGSLLTRHKAWVSSPQANTWVQNPTLDFYPSHRLGISSPRYKIIQAGAQQKTRKYIYKMRKTRYNTIATRLNIQPKSMLVKT